MEHRSEELRKTHRRILNWSLGVAEREVNISGIGLKAECQWVRQVDLNGSKATAPVELMQPMWVTASK